MEDMMDKTTDRK